MPPLCWWVIFLPPSLLAYIFLPGYPFSLIAPPPLPELECSPCVVVRSFMSLWFYLRPNCFLSVSFRPTQAWLSSGGSFAAISYRPALVSRVPSPPPPPAISFFFSFCIWGECLLCVSRYFFFWVRSSLSSSDSTSLITPPRVPLFCNLST